MYALSSVYIGQTGPKENKSNSTDCMFTNDPIHKIETMLNFVYLIKYIHFSQNAPS